MRLFTGFLIAAPFLIAQSFSGPFPQLSRYLELTGAQIHALQTNNLDHLRWLTGKQIRVAEVRQEIVQETERDVLDPAALGIRYAEVAAICREANERAARLRDRNRGLLTAQQGAKLKVLEDALALAALAAEAQLAGLAGYPLISASQPAPGSGAFALIGQGLLPSGCTADPFPGNRVPISRLP